MRSRTLCVLSIVALVAAMVSGSAVASTISLDVVASPAHDPITLSTSLTDWFYVFYTPDNSKLTGTAIYSHNITDGRSPPDPGVPLITFTDGTNPATGTSVEPYYGSSYPALTTFKMHVGAGAGQAVVWAYTYNDYDTTITGTLSSTLESASYEELTTGTTGWKRATFDYSSTQAQNLVVDVAAGGICLVTLNEVPEPGTIVLLASALIGLLAYAWKKRK